ncbi:MAG: hypothetical protein ABIO86_08285 [Sphingomonas sp.]
MKLLLPLLFLSQANSTDCAAQLTFRGVGAVAAAQVRPYADCLNSKIGTEVQLRSSCASARRKAADYGGAEKVKGDVDRALRWLDAMVRQRAACETYLKVES